VDVEKSRVNPRCRTRNGEAANQRETDVGFSEIGVDLLAAFNLKRRAASGVRLPAGLRLNVDPTVSPPAVAGCAAVPLHLGEEQVLYACAAVDCQQARRRLECDG
jgi:hypothetical protein